MAKAAVCVPAPAKYPLDVFKLPPVVQLEPSYSSVAFVAPGAIPPKANATVCEAPAPAKYFLAVLIAPPDVQLVPPYSSVAV